MDFHPDFRAIFARCRHGPETCVPGCGYIKLCIKAGMSSAGRMSASVIAQKLFARVAIARHGGIVDGQKRQCFGIVNPHRLRVGLEQQAVFVRALLEGFSGFFQIGDVAADSDQSGDGAVRVEQRRFRGGDPAAAAVPVQDRLFPVQQRLPGADDLPIIGLIQRGQFGRPKVPDCFSGDFAGSRFRKRRWASLFSRKRPCRSLT